MTDELIRQNKRKVNDDSIAPPPPQILRVRRRRCDTDHGALRVAPQLDALLDNWGLQQHQPTAPSLYERVDDKKRSNGEIIHQAHLLDEDRTTKRRKLQMVPVDRTIESYPTLSPEQNKVNESLLMVFQGTRSLSDHLQMLSTFDDNDWASSWCCPLGTWMHAAALWNQANVAKEWIMAQQQADIIHTLDEEGHSALDIAKLSCHEEMILVLEQLERESEYVYDLYEFKRPENIDTTIANQEGLNVLDCELLRHNAVYKNLNGMVEDSDLLEQTGTNQSDHGSNDDDDDDSNNEDWFANDYPDEDSSADPDGYDSDGDFDPAYRDVEY